MRAALAGARESDSEPRLRSRTFQTVVAGEPDTCHAHGQARAARVGQRRGSARARQLHGEWAAMLQRRSARNLSRAPDAPALAAARPPVRHSECHRQPAEERKLMLCVRSRARQAPQPAPAQPSPCQLPQARIPDPPPVRARLRARPPCLRASGVRMGCQHRPARASANVDKFLQLFTDSGQRARARAPTRPSPAHVRSRVRACACVASAILVDEFVIRRSGAAVESSKYHHYLHHQPRTPTN